MTVKPIRSALLGLCATALVVAAVPPAQAQSTEERLERLERRLDSGALLQLSNQNEQLRRELQRLNGRLDEMEREMADMRRQQRSLYQDLDRRLQAMGSEGGLDLEEQPREEVVAPTVPPTPELDDELAAIDRTDGDAGTAMILDDEESLDRAEEELAAAEERTERPAQDEEQLALADPAPRDRSAADPAEAYREAFNMLRDGRYGPAGEAFRQIIEDHPDSREADNARYWLAESYYVVRDFEPAMEHFTAVAEDPDNNKRPDALLKVGYIHYEQGNYTAAREVLQQVREEYADTTVATLASNRLNRMRDQGR